VAEAMLQGKKITESLLEQVGNKASEEADPVTDIHASEEYRRHLIEALTKRTTKRAWEDAQNLAH
jgi:carbon-monoxide dehydrogenase medium subunit